jgi:hypothetical protein
MICVTESNCALVGMCCTGAASADDLSKDQWQAIRERNTNTADKTKWTIKQSLLAACMDAGFASNTTRELQPVANAASILSSFRSRGAQDKIQKDIPEVSSPDNSIMSPEKPPAKRVALGSTDDEQEVCKTVSEIMQPFFFSFFATFFVASFEQLCIASDGCPVHTKESGSPKHVYHGHRGQQGTSSS